MDDLKILAQAGPFPGKVAHSRSWTSGVYIWLENGTSGWIEEDVRLNSIAAAAEAAGKPVYITYNSHDPNWGNNAGHFFGVKMSLRKDNF